jgi:hypothetical protein
VTAPAAGATTPVAPDHDVVVVGFGGAGAAAAIEAHDAGSRVLLVEKQLESEHLPSTALLAGGLMFAQDAVEAGRYLIACAGDTVPEDVSRAWGRGITELAAWLDGLAPEQFRLAAPYPGAEYPDLPGARTIVSAHGERRSATGEWVRGGGADLFSALRAAVSDRGIEVAWGCRAVRLVSHGDAVTGVEVEDADGVRPLRAGAVVLATGGFGYHEEMKRQYLVGGADVHLYGSPAATGDGIRLAQAVGSDLWHMGSISGRGVGHFVLPDRRILNTIMLLDVAWLGRDVPVGYVIIDGRGRRFADESAQAALSHSFYYEMLAYDPHAGTHPRIPSWWIFDARRLAAGPLTIPGYGSAAVVGHVWSEDNRKEIDLGWVVESDNLDDLARRVGIPPDALVAEVAAHNRAAVTGGDQFRADGFMPLDRPPYYAVPLWPGGTNTTGGPRRDAEGRVIHVFGHAIPGLFAAGEAGQVIGERYPGQYAYYAEVLASGRLAGAGASRCGRS